MLERLCVCCDDLPSFLIAWSAGSRLLDLLHDATEIVGLRRLQRRELLERFQVLQPQLLANWQKVPVVLESGDRTAERTANAHGCLLVNADRLLERVTFDVLHQGKVERGERHDPAGLSRLGHFEPVCPEADTVERTVRHIRDNCIRRLITI
jgi:hypothetical protein